MASKIFGGDMPELLERILNNLSSEADSEADSLFSCTLVNRTLCKTTIPILWKNPFKISETPTFISIYFSSLEESENPLLKEYGIMANFPNTLFQYERFLKVLNLHDLSRNARGWIYHQLPNLQNDMTELECYIANLLLRIFIESGASLSKLELYYFSKCIEIKHETFYFLGQNKHFLSQLHDLDVKIIVMSYIESAISWLRILRKNSTKIKDMKISCYLSFKPQICHAYQLCHAYICIIKSQKQIRFFEVAGNRNLSTKFFGIISALEGQKKTLKEITINNCAYSEEFEVLRNCENLEIIRVSGYNVEKMLESFNTSLCNTLHITSTSVDASKIVQSLKKAGSLLQRLVIYSFGQEIHSQSLLFKTLMTFCPNITYLSFWGITISFQFMDFIGRLQRLQSLILEWIVDESEELMESSIKYFAKVLPSTLKYLSLNNDPLDSHVDILLNHCDAPLKKLSFNIIYGGHNYKKQIEALIEFCNRKKTLKYVDIIDCDNEEQIPIHRNWYKICRDLEGYVELVPHGTLTADC